MPGKSQSHTDAVLNVLRNVRLDALSPYAGLFSVAPADDNSAGTELAGDGYARQAITFGAPAADAGNVRKIANTNNIQFGPALADWDEAVAFGVFDGLEGDLLYWDTLPTPKTVATGDFGQFALGALVVKED